MNAVNYSELQPSNVREQHEKLPSKICAAYPEHSTAYFNNFANITINSDSITPKNKQNMREENSQKDHEIPFDENEGHIRV